MEYKFSPTDFGNLVNASVASNQSEVVTTEIPRKINLDSDSSDLDDLDDLNDFDSSDNLDDLDDLENLDAPVRNESSSFDISQVFNVKRLEQGGDGGGSVVIDYSIDLTIEKQVNEDVGEESIFKLFKRRFFESFMITAGCITLCDLWNQNFVMHQTSNELQAFARLLAMFYHIDCQNSQTLQQIFDTDSSAVIERLAKFNKVIEVSDVTLAIEGKEPEEIYEEAPLNEEAIDNIPEFVTAATESVEEFEHNDNYLDEAGEIFDVSEPPEPDDSIKSSEVKKLSKKAKLKALAELLETKLLSESQLSSINDRKSVLLSYSKLKAMMINGEIDPIEFVKFSVFLSLTKEITIDPQIVYDTKTFNQYFVTLFAKSHQRSVKGSNFSDMVLLLSANDDNVRTLFWEDIALNWRFFQVMFRKTSALKFLNIDNSTIAILQISPSSHAGKMIFHPIKSQLTVLSADFVDSAMNHLEEHNTSEGFDWKYNVQDLYLYYVTKHQLHYNKEFAKLDIFQQISLSGVISYLSQMAPEMFSILIQSDIPYLYENDIAKLSSNPVFAVYQIIIHALKHVGTISVSNAHADGEECSFVLTGSGVPAELSTLDLKSFLDVFDFVMDHVRCSSITVAEFVNGKLHLHFEK